MRTRKAFTLIETMLALLVVPTLWTLTISIFGLLVNYDYRLDERQNFIAVLQLRKRVALGSQIKMKGERLVMNYRNREIELICDEDKVYEIPGYMEYLTHLDRCDWEMESKRIYIRYEYKERTYRIFIGYES